MKQRTLGYLLMAPAALILIGGFGFYLYKQPLIIMAMLGACGIPTMAIIGALLLMNEDT